MITFEMLNELNKRIAILQKSRQYLHDGPGSKNEYGHPLYRECSELFLRAKDLAEKFQLSRKDCGCRSIGDFSCNTFFVPTFPGLTAICPYCSRRSAVAGGKLRDVQHCDIPFKFHLGYARNYQWSVLGNWNDEMCGFKNVKLSNGGSIVHFCKFLSFEEAWQWKESYNPSGFFETHLRSKFA